MSTAGYQYVSSVGNVALWVAFAILSFSAAAFLFLSYARNVKAGARFSYYLVTAINGIAAACYLIMALGSTEYSDVNGARGFLWLRSVDYVFTLPLFLVTLGVLAGGHWTDVFFAVFAAIVAVGMGFAATMSSGYNATWPIYAFGWVASFPVFSIVLINFRSAAYKNHIEIGKLYDVLAASFTLMGLGYGVVLGVSELGEKMTVDQEVIVYAVLDITTKAVFGFVLVFSREAIARYGSFLGGINTGLEFDFPIPASVNTTSSSSKVVFGEHRDLAFAQLHAATGTVPVSYSASYASAEHAPLVIPVMMVDNKSS